MKARCLTTGRLWLSRPINTRGSSLDHAVSLDVYLENIPIFKNCLKEDLSAISDKSSGNKDFFPHAGAEGGTQ